MFSPALLFSTAPFLIMLHFAHRILLLLHPSTTYMRGLYFERVLPYSEFLWLFLSKCIELLIETLSLTCLFFCFTIIFRLNVTHSFWIRTFATLFLSTRITQVTKMQKTRQCYAKISWLCASSDRKYVIKFRFRSTVVWNVTHSFRLTDNPANIQDRPLFLQYCTSLRHCCWCCDTATLMLLDAAAAKAPDIMLATCNLQLATSNWQQSNLLAAQWCQTIFVYCVFSAIEDSAAFSSVTHLTG